MQNRRAQMLERFDADGDGVLSDAERMNARETLQTERRARIQGMGKTEKRVGPPPRRRPPNRGPRAAPANRE